MKMTKILACVLAMTAVMGLGSCKKDSFKIEGVIEGADKASVVVEKADFAGRWQAVDSVRTRGDGSFAITLPRPATPEIYRVVLGSACVYVPVDSIETLTLNSTAKGFGTDFTLGGTPGAENMMKFEKEANRLAGATPDSIARFKRKVFAEIIGRGGADILSYHVLTKTIDRKPLFDIDDDTDMKYFAAVANAYKQFKPNDPHAAMLEESALQAMRRRNSRLGRQSVVQAEEVAYFDIELPDEKGVKRKLSETVGFGKPVLLVFAPMTHKDSPALMRELIELYKRKGGGLEIYQVSTGDDRYEWRDAARNVPWITVFEPAAGASTALTDYNVTELPTFFLFNSRGEVVSRPNSIREI